MGTSVFMSSCHGARSILRCSIPRINEAIHGCERGHITDLLAGSANSNLRALAGTYTPHLGEKVVTLNEASIGKTIHAHFKVVSLSGMKIVHGSNLTKSCDAGQYCDALFGPTLQRP